jgi:hypothetical protein
MRKEDKQIFLVIGVIALAIFLIFSFMIRKNDVAFCRDVFNGLVKGRLLAVEKNIDWGTLKAMGVDVGQAYKKLPDAKEKKDYRKSFVANLSKGFKNAGGNFTDFTNWRTYKHEGLETMIMADYNKKGKKILFTIHGYENRKITAIEWKENNG